jgi:hypothetical protein
VGLNPVPKFRDNKLFLENAFSAPLKELLKSLFKFKKKYIRRGERLFTTPEVSGGQKRIVFKINISTID